MGSPAHVPLPLCMCAEDGGQSQLFYLSDSENLKISWTECLEGIYDQPVSVKLSGVSVCGFGLLPPEEAQKQNRWWSCPLQSPPGDLL